MELEELLKSKDENLFNVFKSVKEKSKDFLKLIINSFPEYTPHDERHSEIVITRLNTIISDSLKNELNKYEIFFLLCSTYLHDIGMADIKQIKDKWGENAEVMRENHHKRSNIFIKECYENIGLEDEYQGKNIGMICLGHRKEDLYDSKLFPYDKAYKDSQINLPLLASFLRIADELDITFERTPQLIYDNFVNNKKSKQEWEKHFSIEGVTTTNNNSFIKCNATCKDPEIHRIIKRLEEKINGQLDDLPYHMHKYSEFIKELPRKCLIEVETEGYEFHDFKFSLDSNYIFDLLGGEQLYGSKDESIRELLKNSVDACRFKQKISKESFEPKISFELTQNNENLIVTDNGIGMDEVSIEKYFTKIGKSIYRSEEFYNNELDFNPLNELGIGFLSCFMISDNIIIDTKKDNCDSLEIEIDKKSDYFLVRKSEKRTTGTKIILNLKENLKENIDLEKIIKKYARHLEYPISIISHNQEEVEINKQNFVACPKLMIIEGNYYEEKNHNEELSKFINNNSKIKIEEDDFEGYFCFRYKKDSHNMNDIVFDNTAKNSILSNQGILVNNNVNLLPTIKDICSFDINLKKNVLDLNIARNDVLHNERYEKFLDNLETVLFDKVEDIFLEIENSTNTTFFNGSDENFCGFSWKLNMINSFFDNFRPAYINEKVSERYFELYADFYSFICVSNHGLSFVKTDFLQNKRVIYVDIDFNGFVRRKFLEEYLEYFFRPLPLDDDFLYIIKPDSYQILESFLDYQPQSFGQILLKKYKSRSNVIFSEEDNKKYFITVDLEKCHNKRLILVDFFNNIFINKNNKLIQFLISNYKNLTYTDKLMVKTLFDSPRNSLTVHKNYKYILDHFVSKKMINNEDIGSYSLDEKELDFCQNNYIWKNE